MTKYPFSRQPYHFQELVFAKLKLRERLTFLQVNGGLRTLLLDHGVLGVSIESLDTRSDYGFKVQLIRDEESHDLLIKYRCLLGTIRHVRRIELYASRTSVGELNGCFFSNLGSVEHLSLHCDNLPLPNLNLDSRVRVPSVELVLCQEAPPQTRAELIDFIEQRIEPCRFLRFRGYPLNFEDIRDSISQLPNLRQLTLVYKSHPNLMNSIKGFLQNGLLIGVAKDEPIILMQDFSRDLSHPILKRHFENVHYLELVFNLIERLERISLDDHLSKWVNTLPIDAKRTIGDLGISPQELITFRGDLDHSRDLLFVAYASFECLVIYVPKTRFTYLTK